MLEIKRKNCLPNKQKAQYWQNIEYAFNPRRHTSLDAAMTSWILLSIRSSTWMSHFSTAPLAADVEMRAISSTRSPSELYMALISRLDRNSNLAMPSKHFFRCGWTLSGSLVSDKISSISSLDKKKNLERKYVNKNVLVTRHHTPESLWNYSTTDYLSYRGKKSRFFSRYAFNPFMIFSKRSLQFRSFSSKPVKEVAART